MVFSAWFKAWIGRHPLRHPVDDDPPRYTAEVMARVRELSRPPAGAPRLGWARSWFAAPRLAFAAAAVAAISVVVLIAHPHGSSERLAREVADGSRLLEAVGEANLDVPMSAGDDAVAEALEAEDEMTLLAAATPSDDRWIEQTVQLLQQIDEETPAGSSGDAAGDAWLDELELLDQLELSTES